LQQLALLIERSVRIKAAVVAEDEREHGRRKVLNFGHTIGHGIEAASEFSLLHGEAVAIGMVAEARLAERQSIAKPGTTLEVERAVSRAGLPTKIPRELEPERILDLMRSDKKRRRGVLEYALPREVGRMAGESSSWGIALDDDATSSAIRAAY
jgi:3-dehydroquinate synthetase